MSQAPRRTRIIATLGPATDRPGMLEAILREGVNVARLNFSHGGADDQRRRAAAVREAAHRLGREVGILADLRGPKIRINQFEHGKVELEPGHKFVLDCSHDAKAGTKDRIGVAYLNLYNDVKRGDTLLLDDGLVAMRVDDIVGLEIRCTVLIGGTLSDRKGLNKLGGGLSVGALTDRDRADVELAAEIGVDYLAVSFARSAEDMNETRALLRKHGSGAGVIGKSKYIYDLWGDTVNLASRMESGGIPDTIQVTRPVYEALKDKFTFESRGAIEVKGKGSVEAWVLRL